MSTNESLRCTPATTSMQTIHPKKNVSFISLQLTRTLGLGTCQIGATRVQVHGQHAWSPKAIRHRGNTFSPQSGLSLLPLPRMQWDAFVNVSQLLRVRGSKSPALRYAPAMLSRIMSAYTEPSNRSIAVHKLERIACVVTVCPLQRLQNNKFLLLVVM